MDGHSRSATSFDPLHDMYDDPAFSNDPHAHPFFATPWSLKPDDDPRLLQLPVTPIFSDDHSSTTHETSSSSAHTSTTISTPPTSTESHVSSEKLRWPPEVQKKKKTITMFWRKTPPETLLASVDISRNVSPEPSPPRSMSPTPRPATSRSVSAPEANNSSDRPSLPPRSVTATADFKPPPSAARRIAGGLALRGSELDRIDELDETAGLPLHHGGPYEAALFPPKQEASVPHVPHNIGSQYQLLPPKPKQDRNEERSQHLHRRNLSEVTSVPIVPAGVSLNLSPGQILPHNFYYQLDPKMIPPTAPFNAPGRSPQPPQPPSQPHHQQQPRHTRHHSQPQLTPPPPPQPQPRNQTQAQAQTQPYPVFNQNTNNQHPSEQTPIVRDDKKTRLDGGLPSSRHGNAPPEYSYFPNGDPNNLSVPRPFSYDKKPKLDVPHVTGDHKRSKQFLMNEHQFYPVPPVNIKPDFRSPSPAPRHHQQNNNRLPPRMQALQMQTPRSEEKPRRSPRPPNGAQEFTAPPVDTGAIQAGYRRRSHTPVQPIFPQMVDHDQQVPLFVDRNGFPASAPMSPYDAPQSVHDLIQHNVASQSFQQQQDPRTPAQSIHSSSRSTATMSGNQRGHPPPSHIPKRLVMPAPLQTSQPVAPRHQAQPLGPPRHINGSHGWQPPPIVPAALDPYIESQLRAEDIQMAQGRKVLMRKRVSVQAIPPPTLPAASPLQPLSFQPTPSSTDMLSPQVTSSRKPEKAQKKGVLSKRRTDF